MSTVVSNIYLLSYNIAYFILSLRDIFEESLQYAKAMSLYNGDICKWEVRVGDIKMKIRDKIVRGDTDACRVSEKQGGGSKCLRVLPTRPFKKGTLSFGLDRTVTSNVLFEVGRTIFNAVSRVRIICLSTTTKPNTEWFSLVSITIYMPAPPFPQATRITHSSG